MKKTRNYLFILFLIGFGIASCESDLEIYSENAISPEQIDASNIQFFLNGLYEASTPNRDNYVFGDVRGGNYTWTALSGNNGKYGVVITGNSLDDRNAYSSSIWQQSYSSIYHANNLITAAIRLEEHTIKAQAQVIRAMMYYNLVTTFGGVPLITTNTTEDLPRNSAEEIWSFIQSDLNDALPHLKDLNSIGTNRISKEFALLLQARVYLALNNKSEAANLAQEIIASSGLTLDANYGDIFRNTQTSSEILFAYKNLETETNVRMSQLFWPYGTEWAGSYFVQPSDYCVEELYEDMDTRKDINIQILVNSDGTSNTIVSKYWDTQPIIMGRLSEVYLIAAEGLGNTTRGREYLNQIRVVRGLSEIWTDTPPTDDAYLNEVLLERRRELYSEGFLFYNLVRTDKAIELPNIPNRKHYLMPIPGSQINLSNGTLTQNPY